MGSSEPYRNSTTASCSVFLEPREAPFTVIATTFEPGTAGAALRNALLLHPSPLPLRASPSTSTLYTTTPLRAGVELDFKLTVSSDAGFSMEAAETPAEKLARLSHRERYDCCRVVASLYGCGVCVCACVCVCVWGYMLGLGNSGRHDGRDLSRLGRRSRRLAMPWKFTPTPRREPKPMDTMTHLTLLTTLLLSPFGVLSRGEGAWAGRTAGGSINFETFERNPQFFIDVAQETSAVIRMTQAPPPSGDLFQVRPRGIVRARGFVHVVCVCVHVECVSECSV